MRRTVYPTLTYDDADAAIDFLTNALGFAEHAVHRDDAGVVVHAQLTFDTGMVMLSQRRSDSPGASKAAVYVAVDDPDAHHDRAVAAGATILRPLINTDYGSRDYGVTDPEGNEWWIGTYRP